MFYYEFDASSGQGFLDLLKALEHEAVVPEVGIGVIICDSKENNNGNFEPVCGANGMLECVVVFGALGSLHPVEDKGAVYDEFFIQ